MCVCVCVCVCVCSCLQLNVFTCAQLSATGRKIMQPRDYSPESKERRASFRKIEQAKREGCRLPAIAEEVAPQADQPTHGHEGEPTALSHESPQENQLLINVAYWAVKFVEAKRRMEAAAAAEAAATLHNGSQPPVSSRCSGPKETEHEYGSPKGARAQPPPPPQQPKTKSQQPLPPMLLGRQLEIPSPDAGRKEGSDPPAKTAVHFVTPLWYTFNPTDDDIATTEQNTGAQSGTPIPPAAYPTHFAYFEANGDNECFVLLEGESDYRPVSSLAEYDFLAAYDTGEWKGECEFVFAQGMATCMTNAQYYAICYNCNMCRGMWTSWENFCDHYPHCTGIYGCYHSSNSPVNASHPGTPLPEQALALTDGAMTTRLLEHVMIPPSDVLQLVAAEPTTTTSARSGIEEQPTQAPPIPEYWCDKCKLDPAVASCSHCHCRVCRDCHCQCGVCRDPHFMCRQCTVKAHWETHPDWWEQRFPKASRRGGISDLNNPMKVQPSSNPGSNLVASLSDSRRLGQLGRRRRSSTAPGPTNKEQGALASPSAGDPATASSGSLAEQWPFTRWCAAAPPADWMLTWPRKRGMAPAEGVQLTGVITPPAAGDVLELPAQPTTMPGTGSHRVPPLRSDGTMQCPECGQVLCDIQELAFFLRKKTPNDGLEVHLILKPELLSIPPDIIRTPHPDEGALASWKCACGHKLGNTRNIGPKKVPMMAFSSSSVKLLGQHYTQKKPQWPNVYSKPPFNAIEVRTSTEFDPT